jgi:hypothetical protein
VARQPDASHERPEGVDDATVAAAGKVGEYFEWAIRARGRLYDFHQMMGRADLVLGDAVDELEAAGHGDLAARLQAELVGRNAITDRWTFEIVEDFDDVYFRHAQRWAWQVRDELLAGRDHVFEAEMKARRRSDGPDDDR